MKPSLPPETNIGIEVFLTDTNGIGGKLRVVPDDFIVQEISLPPPMVEDGEFTIIRIKAYNWETNRLIRNIAKQLGISRKRVGFAGTKDKRAITEQLLSVHLCAEKIKNLKIADCEIIDLYKSNKPVAIGDLIGNKFVVKVSSLAEPLAAAEKTIESVKDVLFATGGFPNFYGIQRFGAVRPITHLVGKYIVKADFKNAVHTYLGEISEYEPAKVSEARRYFLQTFDCKECLKKYPADLTFERAILNHLLKKPADYIGALMQLPKNLLMMFVHAYQAYMFNQILSARLKKKLPINEALLGDIVLRTNKYGLPSEKTDYIEVTEQNISKINTQLKSQNAFVSGLVIGYKSKFASGVEGEIENEIVSRENVSETDFIIPALPKLSSKGIRRAFVARIDEFEYKLCDNAAVFKFVLRKGCYATALLREFMKTAPINY